MVWRDRRDLHTVAWDMIPDRDLIVVGGRRRSLRRLRPFKGWFQWQASLVRHLGCTSH